VTAAADLRATVLAALARGAAPEDVARVRRRLGEDAGPPAVAAAVARDVTAAVPSDPPTPPDDGQVRVCDVDMPARLSASWPAGGPLWVRWRGADPGPGPAVAVVGTRRPTLDGLTLAEGIAGELAAAGVTVVSGMARGIDQAAHRGALGAGGRTTAVLGTGHDVDYPAGSGDLRRAVQASGGVASEYAASRGVRTPAQFIARNRILAGLADATLVIEAGLRSGALSTARWAADMGRQVMVVPSSPANPAAAGALALLVDGATPVRHATDVLDALGVVVGGDGDAPEPVAPPLDLDPVGAALIGLLGPTPTTPSALAAATGHPPREVLVALARLEEVGVVAHAEGGVVRIARPTGGR
jgi:DNA processing protein